ncbi:hypothetical protein D3C72_1925760 [compost metagenome]
MSLHPLRRLPRGALHKVAAYDRTQNSRIGGRQHVGGEGKAFIITDRYSIIAGKINHIHVGLPTSSFSFRRHPVHMVAYVEQHHRTAACSPLPCYHRSNRAHPIEVAMNIIGM